MLKTLKLFLLLAVVSLLASCATVKGHVHDADFRAENLPLREVRVLVVTDGSHGRDQIDQLIWECSRVFDEQVGIRFVPIEYISIQWEKRDPTSMLEKLFNAAEGHEFDLAIGFTRWNVGEGLMRNLMGAWEGCIDDTYRRYIIVKHLDRRTLLHEVGHAFIFSTQHSTAGLMMPVSFQLLPFIPVKLESLYFTQEDRREVLKNKWRDFSEIPVIAAREHTLAPGRRTGEDR